MDRRAQWATVRGAVKSQTGRLALTFFFSGLEFIMRNPELQG